MDYSFFLFSQLFMTHVEDGHGEYEDLAYDIMYDIVREHHERFMVSSYNVNVRSEYDCITDYLTNEIK